ncbi:hypothetical protein ACWF94_24845 [Streptomyces sp. NPDC055078]
MIEVQSKVKVVADCRARTFVTWHVTTPGIEVGEMQRCIDALEFIAQDAGPTSA